MKTMDTRNVLIVEIERLDKRIADLLRSCKDKDAIIDEQRTVIHVMSGGYGERIIADNKTLKAKLVDVNRRFDHVVRFNEKLVHDTNELFAERDATIKELEGKLTDREMQFNELDGVLDRTRELLHAAMVRIQTQNDATYYIGERDAVIKELEGKLADSERRFNELDAVLVRTFALLHVVNGCLRKRDKTIDELESELHR